VYRCLNAISTAGLDAADVAKAVDEESGYLYRLPRNWRWWCLRYLLREFSGRPGIFWPLFLSWSTDSEGNLTHGWLQGMLERALAHEPPHRYLDPPDKEFFDSLPDRVTVYRGVARPGRHVGISWTIDRGIAEWFAARNTFGGKVPTLLSGHVRKPNIIAAIAGNKESEVLVFPRHVRGRSETRLPVRDLGDLRPAHWSK
jgi:hypothetical protein